MDRTGAFVWQSPDEVEWLSREELERIKKERDRERRAALEDERLDRDFEREERKLARRRAPWINKYLGRMTEMILDYRRGEMDLPTLCQRIANHYSEATEADPDDWDPGKGLDDELDDALNAGMLKEEGDELVENEEVWLSEGEYAEVWDAINTANSNRSTKNRRKTNDAQQPRYPWPREHRGSSRSANHRRKLLPMISHLMRETIRPGGVSPLGPHVSVPVSGGSPHVRFGSAY